MQKVFFVMGGTASGKTYFIEHYFAGQDVEVLNIYDYQQEAYDEVGYDKMIPIEIQFRCLMKANEMLLNDIIERVRKGKDVVVEQTFFKAKRRIVYIEAIRKAVERDDIQIDVYVMCPSNEQWQKNIQKRGLEKACGSFEMNTAEIEFPNLREGFSSIYEVSDDDITLRHDPLLDNQVLEKARKEIEVEKERIQKEDEDLRKRRELLERMKQVAFWHYCEVCGKKSFITAEEAFHSGWDYPPKIGVFGLLGPRKCGKCSLENTLYWKITSKKLSFVLEEELTDTELITWRRIKGEPESLLKKEEDLNNGKKF